MGNINNLHRTYQQTRLLTKYGMTAICVLMTMHCGLLFFGKDLFIIHALFVIFTTAVAVQISRIYKLCIVHQMSIVYSMSVILCVVLRRHDIFSAVGIDIHAARGVMCFVGVIMVLLNIGKCLHGYDK